MVVFILLIDDMRLSSGARSRDLKGHDNHQSIPINRLLRSDQTRHRRDRNSLFTPRHEFFSLKGELLLPDSLRGVQRNPAIMCDFGFGFREKTGFGSKLVPFNLSTSS